MPARIPALVLAGGLVALASTSVSERVAHADLVRVAGLTEVGENVSDEALARAGATALSMAPGDCAPDALRAGVTVRLASLDRAFGRTGDVDPAEAEATRDFLRHVVSCSPADGNAWIRLAMLEQALGAEPDRQVELVGRAARLAPAEAAVLAARIFFWIGAEEETRSAGRALLREDLGLLLTYAEAGDVAALLAVVPEDIEGETLAIMAGLGPERRGELLGAGIPWLDADEPGDSARVTGPEGPA